MLICKSCGHAYLAGEGLLYYGCRVCQECFKKHCNGILDLKLLNASLTDLF